MFSPSDTGLPVAEIIPEVQRLMETQHTLIVNAPPGAGKSTVLPLALLHEPWLNGKKIILLEPRRLAAKTIALRMAQLLGQEAGQTVGYRIRFEHKVSAVTRIEVVTEGILTRMLQTDNALEEAALVIFDEFHERSLQADLALALCREAQQVLRPDLRMLIMSATLDLGGLATLLQAPVVVSEGRQYPVDIVYNDAPDLHELPEATARFVFQVVKKHTGDILVFLPGEAEIRRCAEMLEPALPDFAIHPLYGMLSPQEQQQAITPSPYGRRKVVLATSIAETSLTIEGISVVVDSGYARVSRFNPASGLSRLTTVQVSKDAADQRAGRAGRLGPGTCYRLWTKATHERLAERRIPEILEADLAPLVLELAQWGVTDAGTLTWLTAPPRAALQQATDILQQLGALENGKITAHGKQIQLLACHPRLAHMLLRAREEGIAPMAADIAALLEERDPLPREAGTDINLRIEALHRARKSRSASGIWGRIEKLSAYYRELLHTSAASQTADAYQTGKLLALAYPERIAAAKPGQQAQFLLANGSTVTLDRNDMLAHEAFLAVALLDPRDGMGKIFMASPVQLSDLLPMATEKQLITWDSRKGGIVATSDLRLGSLVLQSRPLPSPDGERVRQALLQALRTEGKQLLSWSESVINLQNRILSLRRWNAEEGWPEVTTDALLSGDLEWIIPYLDNMRKTDDLRRLDLEMALKMHLGWEKQQELDKLAPEKIEVPTGSRIALQYQPNGEPPVLAVRLQEVFGWADTPTVNHGKVPVLLHLLSPGFKPVQVTGDLRSFWNNTYFEVRSELKRRYPRHSWPDDPWTAVPVAKGGVRK